MISDDAANRAKSTEDGIFVASVEEYLSSLLEHPDLLDKISRKNYNFESNKNALFPSHLSITQIHEGIKSTKYYQGSFISSRENYLEGSVNVENFEKPVC